MEILFGVVDSAAEQKDCNEKPGPDGLAPWHVRIGDTPTLSKPKWLAGVKFLTPRVNSAYQKTKCGTM